MNFTTRQPSLLAIACLGAMAAIPLAGSRPALGDHCDPDAVLTIGQTGGFIDVEGDIMCTISGGFMKIFDVQDPTNPVQIGQWDRPDGEPTLRNVDVQGDYAYIVGGLADLQIIDIHIPDEPERVGNFQMFFSNSQEVVASGSTLYVVAENFGAGGFVHVFDVADVTDPQLISSVELPYPRSIEVVGTTAYVGDQDLGLLIYDVSDPQNFVQLSTYALPPSLGSYAKVLDGIAYVGASTAGLHILDVSNPASPTFLSSLEFEAYEPFWSGGLLYVAAGDTMEVVDVMDPANPFVLGSINEAGFLIDRVEYKDGYALAPFGSSVTVVDVIFCGDPFVISGPQSTVAMPDDVVQFSVTGGGNELMYQWRLNGVPLPERGLYSGTQTPTLTVTAAVESEGYYDCVLTNLTGEAVSNPAVLAVLGGAPACPADIVNSATFQPPPDGVVDGADLAFLLGAWGLCE